MNTKTTLYLVVLLSLLVAGFLYVTNAPPKPEEEADRGPANPGAAVARDVLAESLGDPVKIVVQRNGEDEPWVFEATDKDENGYPIWEMTAPTPMKVMRWQVERIANSLKRAQYVLSFKPGEPGSVTPEEAGLAPPQWTATITDADGKSASLEVGIARSPSESYARRPGQDEILVSTTSFKDLLLPSRIAYRVQEFWSFKPEDVRRVEIVDRTGDQPVTYILVPDGRTGWRFEQPFSGPATDKVKAMVQTFGNMRALKWHSDDPARLRGYGFEPAAYTFRATVEEQVPVESDETESAKDESNQEEGGEEKPKTRTELTTHEFEMSTQSPLGEDSKVFVRLGGTAAVGDILKVAADKLRLSPSEWRDLRVTVTPIAAPSRVDLTTPEGSAAFVRRDGRWFFDDGRRAEDALVDELIATVSNLRAVVFEDQAGDPTQYGLDQPQIDIRLTTPASTSAKRLVIGNYTDPQTRRLVYARFEDGPVSKLRVEDIQPLLRAPREYLDRTVFQFSPNRIERLSLSRPNPVTGDRESLVFEKPESQWIMAEPVSAPVRQDRLGKFVDNLGGLRAETVLADNGELSAFGLRDPEVTIAFSYRPPVEFRMEPKAKAEGKTATDSDASDEDNGTEANSGDLVQVEYQPPSQTYTLWVTMHDGKAVAAREGAPQIYALPRAFFDQLGEEFRSGELFRFDPEAVSSFSIRNGDASFAFEKSNDAWKYTSEPDLPLDQAKVQNLLLQIHDLKAGSFLTQTDTPPAQFGLDQPARQVSVKTNDSTAMLNISSKTESARGIPGQAANVSGVPGVFLIPVPDLARLEVRMEDLEAR
ncbi:MAG: DUF4340 domain-containing protein [Phycisphaerae bacterium]|nr:DUF4340 domain-containing protein [Phycisphaerae bacterium]